MLIPTHALHQSLSPTHLSTHTPDAGGAWLAFTVDLTRYFGRLSKHLCCLVSVYTDVWCVNISADVLCQACPAHLRTVAPVAKGAYRDIWSQDCAPFLRETGTSRLWCLRCKGKQAITYRQQTSADFPKLHKTGVIATAVEPM